MNTVQRLRATEPTTPLYRRAVPRFQDLLGASPTRVIPAMDFSGDDIPYQLPKVRLALPSVGLNRHHVPVQLSDPLGSGSIVQASCDVQVRTHVPSHKRGIHTSRIGDAIANTCLEIFPSLQAFAAALANDIDETQYN